MTKSKFLPGGTCLYYKVYCSPSYSDTFLTKKLKPFVSFLDDKIKHWFFIRYRDSEEHLRVRFFVSKEFIGEVWKAFHDFFTNEVEQSPVKKIEMGTYERELMRYGKVRIELIEKLWSYETELLTIVLKELTNEDYIVFCILLAKKYLTSFYKGDESINTHINNRINSFYKEFNIERKDRELLNKKYKNIENKLTLSFKSQHLLSKHQSVNNKILNLLLQINSTFSAIDKTYVVSSIIHMFFNRCFYSDQRMMEMVCYHHLNSFNNKLRHVQL